ncbi:MAG: hypothetical protein AAF497_10790, partial [Planctomycetota bacterium]
EIYRTEDWSLVDALQGFEFAWPVSFSRDSRLVLLTVREPRGVLLYDLEKREKLALIPSDLESTNRDTPPAITSDHQYLVTTQGSNGLVAWDLHAIRKQLRELNLDWSDEELTEALSSKAVSSLKVDFGELQVGMLKSHLEFIHSQEAIASENVVEIAKQNAASEATIKIAKAQIELYRHHYDESLRLLNEVLANDPQNFDALRSRVDLYEMSGQLGKAVADLLVLLEHDEISGTRYWNSVGWLALTNDELASHVLRYDDHPDWNRFLGTVRDYLNGDYHTVIDRYEPGKGRWFRESVVLSLAKHRLLDEKDFVADRKEWPALTLQYAKQAFAAERIVSGKLRNDAAELAEVIRPHSGRIVYRHDNQSPNVFWQIQDDSARFVVPFVVEESREYELEFQYVADAQGPYVEIRFDGETIESRLNCFSQDDESRTVILRLGKLTTGQHHLELRTSGSCRESSGTQLRIVSLKLR